MFVCTLPVKADDLRLSEEIWYYSRDMRADQRNGRDVSGRVGVVSCAVLACLLLAAAPALFSADGPQVNVRVRQTPSGPRIFVDGVPRAPHMVWVRDTVAPQPAGTDWQPWSAALRPAWDVTHWRFAVRCEQKPGLLQVRKVRLAGSDGSDIPICETQDLRVVSGKMRDGDFVRTFPGRETLKKGVTYTVSLEVRAEGGISWFRAAVEPLAGDGLYHAWLEELPYADGKYLTSCGQVRAAAAVGVDFVTFGAGSWLNADWEGPPDWTALDACVDRMLAANPKALLIPRVDCVPPEKWYEKHPDARMKLHDGTLAPMRHASIHYEPFRRDLLRNLEAFIRHMMERYPRNFAGIHPAGQNTSEWFYAESWTRMCGYDRGALEAWRRWLKARGAADADWAAVPPPEDRRRKREPARLFDPADPVQARCVEYQEFLNASMVDFLNGILGLCRRVTEGRKLVVAFYGYTWEFAGVHQGPGNTGHYALMKLLREGGDSLDILASPLSYDAEDRRWCGSTPMMSAVETAQRRGILWVQEDDSRTHLDQRRAESVQEGGTVTQAQTHDLMRRNNAFEALRGCGSWWMDLCGHGWHSDPVVWQTISEQRDFEEALRARKAQYLPDVALIADERSMLSLNFGGKCATAPLFTTGRRAFARTGTGYGQYLEEDVVERPIRAKLQIHLSAWRLSDETLSALATDRSARPDVTRVWCWAPGYVGEGGFDVRRTQTLTGFRVREVTSATLDAVATEEGLARGFPERMGLRDGNGGGDVGPYLVTPKLAVEPRSGDVVLMNWTDGTAAVVARRNSGGRGWSVFYGPTVFTLESANALVGLVGVHSYLEKPDGSVTLFAAGDRLALQAQEATSATVVWPNRTRQELELRKGEVRLSEMGKRE